MYKRQDRELIARNSYGWELEDVARVRAHVRSGEVEGVDPLRGGLFGHSRGGGMALLSAAEAGDCRALVSWAGIGSVLRFSAERLREWRERGEIWVQHHGLPRESDGSVARVRLELSVLEDAERQADRLDIHAACGRLRCPALFVQGTRDRGIPVAEAEGLARACPDGLGQVLVVEDAGHAFGAGHPLREIRPVLKLALDATRDWFRRHLQPGPSGLAPPDAG